MFGSRFKFWILLCHKKTFELMDPDLKVLDPRKLLKKNGCMEKVKMKTKLERQRKIHHHFEIK